MRARRVSMGAAVLAWVAAGVLLPGPAVAGTPDGPAQGQFASRCRFSHRAPDDPIVKPGQPGVSHSHDFIGNRTTNASSDYDSMIGKPTTCRNEGDTAGYWEPTLYVDGQALAPRASTAYYRTARKDPASIEPFPAGLMIVAGDAKATAPQDPRVTTWGCGADSSIPDSREVPACPDGSWLHLRVRFPDCWDGSRLDSPDHKSHMAYSRRGRCPSSHAVSVPSLTINTVYPTRGGSGVTLASGGTYTAHADFFNTWDQPTLASLVARCLNADIRCGTI